MFYVGLALHINWFRSCLHPSWNHHCHSKEAKAEAENIKVEEKVEPPKALGLREMEPVPIDFGGLSPPFYSGNSKGHKEPKVKYT